MLTDRPVIKHRQKSRVRAISPHKKTKPQEMTSGPSDVAGSSNHLVTKRTIKIMGQEDRKMAKLQFLPETVS